MLIPRKRSPTEIHYYLITEEDPFFVPYLPPTELAGPVLDFICLLPKDFLQIGKALTYYELSIRLNQHNPLRFSVIYTKNLEHFLPTFPKNVIRLFFIDQKVEELAKVMEKLLAVAGMLDYYFIHKNDIGFTHSNLVSSPGEFLRSLLEKQEEILKILGFPGITLYPSISVMDNEFHRFPRFVPANNNYHIANCIIGNFSFEDKSDFSEEKLYAIHGEESKKAFERVDTFERLERVLSQMNKIDYFNRLCLDSELVKPVNDLDNYLHPLILVAPFQNPDIFKLINGVGDDQALHSFLTSLNIEQSKNYTLQGPASHPEYVAMFANLVKNRVDYLDKVSTLHASFTVSPVLRLPIQGRSIYRNLSFFRAEAAVIRSQPANRKKLNKTKGSGKTHYPENSVSGCATIY